VLNPNWYKNYVTTCKKMNHKKNANEFFFTKSQENVNENICILCHNS
jgi:hypothetical protein